MNLVCILGSPHGIQGNTARLLELVLEGAGDEGARAEIVLLETGTVLPCNGCDHCHRSGRCTQPDAFEEIRGRIDAADGLVLASPNYLNSVSAQLKAFMDRCCGTVHRLAFGGKYGASVMTSGGGGDEPIIDYMNRFLLMTGIRPVGGVHATMALMPQGEFTGEIRERARHLGAELVRAWREERRDPETDQAMAAFRERMRQLVVWKKEDWPYEYGYWQEHYGLA